MTLSAINRYPIKSCRGDSLESVLVERCGLAGDRRWLVVDETGLLRTARELPKLLLVVPTVTEDGLLMRCAGFPDLAVAVPQGRPLTQVRVWRSTLDAMLVADDAHAWFTSVLGVPSRLVYLDDPTRRLPNQEFAGPDDRVSFADGYPLTVATTASLAQLNTLIDSGPRAGEGPIEMTRFRPSLVVDGSLPWEEDGWRRLRIGELIVRSVKGCDRCAIPMTDPWTTARGKEPIATLAKHRRWDGETWFAMNLVPDNPGVRVTVGDEVEILEAVDAPDGPPH